MCRLRSTPAPFVLVWAVRVRAERKQLRLCRRRQRVGFVSASTLIYDRMSAWELVEFFGRLAGLRGDRLRGRLEERVKKALAREHLSSFVVTTIGGTEREPTLQWHVDAAKRRELEKTRLGRRVLCTDRHNWSTGRIVYAFRGQWNVEELFRRAKKGGVVPWGPSHQWADGSLRLHTFATVLGLMLVSLARIELAPDASARRVMESLDGIEATLVRTTTGGPGRRPTVMLAPELTAEQRRAVKVFELERWFPNILSSSTVRPAKPN